MRGKQFRMALVPLALAAGLGACASNGVAPGYVTGPSSASATSSSYGTPTGEAGRVVSINEVAMRGGSGSSGGTGGMMTGGLIGAAGGGAIGAAVSNTLPGLLVGAVLGAVGGAITGNIINNHTSMGPGGRGIEVAIQKDDGQTVRVAQRDDGDIQLGDRVQIVKDRSGTARAVRDTSPSPDYGNQNGGYQNANSQYNGPPPQDMQGGGNSQRYTPRDQYNGPQDQNGAPPAEYGQRYSQSRSAPRPQDDPRYGNLD